MHQDKGDQGEEHANKNLQDSFKSLGVLSFGFGLLYFVSFNDGPTEIFPGAFTSGELVTGEPDWSFARTYPAWNTNHEPCELSNYVHYDSG